LFAIVFTSQRATKDHYNEPATNHHSIFFYNGTPKTTLLSIATGHQGPIPFPVQRTINYHSIFPYNWPSTTDLFSGATDRSISLYNRSLTITPSSLTMGHQRPLHFRWQLATKATVCSITTGHQRPFTTSHNQTKHHPASKHTHTHTFSSFLFIRLLFSAILYDKIVFF
jgi:hypothetical protein